MRSNFLDTWLFRLKGPESGAITFEQRRVFILPTRNGLLFSLMLLSMLIGSMNYQLSLGYFLTFTIASCAVIAMHDTFRNLAWIRLTAIKASPVFPGETLQFELMLDNSHKYSRSALHIMSTSEKSLDIITDIPACHQMIIHYPVLALKRGVIALPRLCIYSTFPFGLWRAWGYWHPMIQAVVYPLPEKSPPELPRANQQDDEGFLNISSDDHFSSIRPYLPGDKPSRIAWRTSAKLEDSLASKQMENSGTQEILLDWFMLPDELTIDQRASRLAAWVIQAETQGLSYGLRIPRAATNSSILNTHTEIIIETASGSDHQKTCLTALALIQ